MNVWIFGACVGLGGRVVTVGEVIHFLSPMFGNHGRCGVLCHGVEIAVDHTIRVSFPTLAGKSDVGEACVQEHLPNVGVSPVVRLFLGEYFDAEVVMVPVEPCVNSHMPIKRDYDEVLSKLFEGLIESSLVIFSLAFTIADNSISITNEKKHTAMVHPV